MKTYRLVVSLAILFLTTGLHGQQYELKTADIRFEFVSKGTKGTLGDFQSESIIDWQHPDQSILKGSVATATLDTNNGLRNWSLKSGKYFDEDAHPRIYFESSSIEEKEGQWIVRGTLTLKGTAKPLILTFSRNGQQLKATGSLYSSDFGINIKKDREDNRVDLTLTFTLKGVAP